MAISSLGVGSGLDLNGIVTKLMLIEQQPITRLQTKQSTFTSQISALGQIKSAMASLQTASSAMATPSKLYSYAASLADPTIATASAAAGAVDGTYGIEVKQLASAHKLVSSSPVTIQPGGGSLDIEIGGNTTTVAIAGGASLSDIANSINSANAGVNATVINGDGGPQLVVTSKTTGTDGLIKMTGSTTGVTGLDFDPVSGTGNMVPQEHSGENARVIIDGSITVSSASNTLKDAISGVTLNLTKTGSTQLTVSGNDSALKEKAEAFVKAYNSAMTTMKNLSKYSAEGTSGILNGDSTVRSLMSELRSVLSNVPADADPAYAHLLDLGISSQADGLLKLDAEKLTAATGNDFAAVANTLSAYGSAFDAVTTRMNSTEGLITTRTEGIQKSSRLIDTQIETLNARLAQTEARYRSQFSALDTLLGTMQTTSDFLTQQITLLGNMSSSK